MYFINKIWDLTNNNHMQICYDMLLKKKKKSDVGGISENGSMIHLILLYRSDL